MKMNVCKSMGSDDIHPRVLREMTDIFIEPFSIISEKSCLSSEVPGDWKKRNCHFYLQEREEEGPRETQAGEPHFCAWENHGTDPPGRHVKAREGQAGDLRQTAHLHQRKFMPDQSSGFLRWSVGISGQRKGN